MLRAPNTVVLVLIRWRGDAIAARTVERAECLWLGEGAGELPIPSKDPAGSRLRLVSFEGASPVIVIAGDRPLETGESAQLEIGDFSLTVTRLEADRMRRGRFGAGWIPARYVAGAAAVLLSTLATLAYAVPLFSVSPGAGIGPEHPVAALPIVEIDSEQELAAPLPGFAASPTRFLVSVAGESRCGAAEMGQAGAERLGGRYGVEGPKDNPDPHIASERGAMQRNDFIVEHSRKSTGGDPKAPSVEWGRDTALGHDEESARGAMWGDPIEPASGADGLGQARLEGGLNKRLAWADVKTQTASARVLHTGLRVEGSLRPSAIHRATASRFDAFRACYDRALERSPGLGGRLDLRLEIGKDGRVSLRIERSNVDDPELGRCLVANLQGLSFPGSDTGATSAVYPLFFEPGDSRRSAENQVRPVTLRPREPKPACCSL